MESFTEFEFSMTLRTNFNPKSNYNKLTKLFFSTKYVKKYLMLGKTFNSSRKCFTITNDYHTTVNRNLMGIPQNQIRGCTGNVTTKVAKVMNIRSITNYLRSRSGESLLKFSFNVKTSANNNTKNRISIPTYLNSTSMETASFPTLPNKGLTSGLQTNYHPTTKHLLKFSNLTTYQFGHKAESLISKVVLLRLDAKVGFIPKYKTTNLVETKTDFTGPVLKFTPYVFNIESRYAVNSALYMECTKPTHCNYNPPTFLKKVWPVLFKDLYKLCANYTTLPYVIKEITTVTYGDSFSERNTYSTGKITLTNTGLFVLNNLVTYFRSQSYNHKYLYKIKKYTYSFLKPNQVKSAALNRKASIVLYKSLIESNRKTNYALLEYVTLSKTLSSDSLSLVGTECQFSKKTITRNHDNHSSLHNVLVNPSSEVKIPRIRFRPGYKRLWRESRSALKELLGVKFIYQKQLTNYLTRFYKKSSQLATHGSELVLYKLVLYSRLVPDINTFNLFFNLRIFFLNGLGLLSRDVTCVPNDFIQLIVSKWYYVFSRWLFNWVLVRLRKVKRLIYRKGLSSRYTIMKSKKMRSRTVPDWIFNSKYDFSDVKPFIEVDYFTLSFFVVYEPYLNYYYAPTKLMGSRVNTYRLYNWKYIT